LWWYISDSRNNNWIGYDTSSFFWKKRDCYSVPEYMCICPVSKYTYNWHNVWCMDTKKKYIVSSRWISVLSRQFSILFWHLNNHHGECFYLHTTRYVYSAILGEIMNQIFAMLIDLNGGNYLFLSFAKRNKYINYTKIQIFEAI